MELFTAEELASKWRVRPSTIRRYVAEGLFTLERSSVLAFVATERGRNMTLRAIAIDGAEMTAQLVEVAGEDCYLAGLAQAAQPSLADLGQAIADVKRGVPISAVAL